MSEPTVQRSSRVDADLYEIAIYIAEDSPQSALRFLEAAEATLKELAAMPGMGRPRKFKTARLENVRSWRIEGFRNYLVFYHPTMDGIEVIRVLHGGRDIETLFAEE